MHKHQALTRFAGAFAVAASLLFASVPVALAETGQNMWRLYNPNSGEHFYTGGEAEMRNLASLGWYLEGVGWVAPLEGDPVYRLYNPNSGDH
ncbi:MAG: hypothetical protein Q4B54_03470, partial [Coriobacteriales bacterium]|nr:hypothetical protein [Coriobacteriales bacterium]